MRRWFILSACILITPAVAAAAMCPLPGVDTIPCGETTWEDVQFAFNHDASRIQRTHEITDDKPAISPTSDPMKCKVRMQLKDEFSGKPKGMLDAYFYVLQGKLGRFIQFCAPIGM